MTKVRKAIIPAAGLGTRFLPQTKAMPKEMLPIIDKPIIQIAVEELVAAGVTDIIIVTGSQKRAIEDHFDRDPVLEEALEAKGKHEAAKQIRDIADMANFIYVRQKGEPKGNARPVINAMHLLGDEPFFYLFPDDFFAIQGPGSAMQMLDAFEANGSKSPVLSLVEIDKKDADKYGVIKPGKTLADGLVVVEDIIEKPGADAAPSNLASVNGYLLTPDMLPIIEALQPDASGEIGIPSALQTYAKTNQVLGKKIEGKYLDCGNKVGYVEAILYAAQFDEETKGIVA